MLNEALFIYPLFMKPLRLVFISIFILSRFCSYILVTYLINVVTHITSTCVFSRETNKAFCGFLDQSKYRQYKMMFKVMDSVQVSMINIIDMMVTYPKMIFYLFSGELG